MAAMKKGTRINLLDSNYQDICVGDVLNDPHTGSELTVSKFGAIINPIGKSVEKKDAFYRIVRRWDENLAPAKPVEKKVEETPVEMPEASQNENEAPSQDEKDAALAEHLGEEMLAVIKSQNERVARFEGIDSGDLVEELRRRGWTVTCTRERIVRDEI